MDMIQRDGEESEQSIERLVVQPPQETIKKVNEIKKDTQLSNTKYTINR